MPTLRRRLTDGGHVIVAFLHGAGGCATYQVSSEGLAYLRSVGVDLGAPRVRLSHAVVETLRTRACIHTGGRGLSDAPGPDPRVVATAELLAILTTPPQPPLGAADADVAPPSARATSGDPTGIEMLVVHEPSPGTQGWQLALALADLPLGALGVAHGAAQVDRLSSLRLAIDGDLGHPLLHWWPGRAAPIVVAPHATDYALLPIGAWPAALQRAWLPPRVPGLAHSGTLFHTPGAGGARLAAGAPVATGEGYVVVSRATAPDAPTRTADRMVPPPPSLHPVPLGSIAGWEATAITIGRDPDTETRVWLSTMGHPIRDALWTVDCVAPVPERWMATSAVVIPVGRPCVLRVSAPPNACHLPEQSHVVITGPDAHASAIAVAGDGWAARFAVFVPQQSGTYLIRGPGWLRPTMVVAMTHSDDATRLMAGDHRSGVTVDIAGVRAAAFATTPTELPLERLLPASPHAGTPLTGSLAVHLHCPVARYTVCAGPVGASATVRHATAATLAITVQHLLARMPRGQPWSLTIDAGPAFGMAAYTVTWPPVGASPTAPAAAPHGERLRRWLALVRPVLLGRGGATSRASAATSHVNALSGIARHAAADDAPTGTSRVSGLSSREE